MHESINKGLEVLSNHFEKKNIESIMEGLDDLQAKIHEADGDRKETLKGMYRSSLAALMVLTKYSKVDEYLGWYRVHR